MATDPVSAPCEKETVGSSVHMDEKKMDPNATTLGDYSGAVAKSDPAEIALVRKLDKTIMVPKFYCPSLRASQADKTAYPLGDVLPQLLGSKRSPASSPEYTREGPAPQGC